MKLVLAILSLLAVAIANPLDDYVSKPEEVYGWTNSNVKWTTAFGNTAYLLNVTSQTYMTEDKVYTFLNKKDKTNIWTHQVVVVVPHKMVYNNVSMAYLSLGCNNEPMKFPADVGNTEFHVVDEMAQNT